MKSILGACLILSVLGAGVEGEAPPTDIAGLVRELSSRLVSLGSFQAEYKAVSPGKEEVRLLFRFSKRERYMMIKIVNFDPEYREIYSVLDFSEMSGWDGSVYVFLVFGNEGKRISYSLREMRRLDNPIGFVFFLKKCLGFLENLHPEKIDIKQIAPTMSLELSEDSLSNSLGFSTGSHLPAASWLDEETIEEAVAIEEFEDSVRFSYQSDHVVWVDKETGLLLEDSWPVADRPGPRTITLEQYFSLDREVPYSALIPEFQSIEFEEIPQQQLGSQLIASLLEDSAVMHSVLDCWDKLLERHADGVDAVMREFGRMTLRKDEEKIVDDKTVKEFLEEVLLPVYGECKKRYPHISFSEFLKNVRKTFEENPDAVPKFLPDKTADFVEILKKKYDRTLDDLPEDVREPLRKINDALVPPLVEGYGLEFFFILLDRAEKLNPEGDDNASNEVR